MPTTRRAGTPSLVYHAAVGACFLFCRSGFVYCQNGQDQVSPDGKAAGRNTQRDPSAASPLHGLEPLFSLLASTSATEATASAGFNFTPQGSADLVATFTLTGPVSRSGEPSDLADLNGLAGTSRGELNFGRTAWKQHFVDPTLPTKLCMSSHVAGLCTRGNLPEAARPEWDRNVTMAGTWFLNGDVQASRQEFSFRDPTTLKPGSRTATPHNVGSNGGFYLATNSVIQGRFEFQRVLKAGTSTQVCTPIGAVGALRCDSAVLGGPSIQTSEIATMEWRYSHSSDFAVSPTVHYDLRQKITAFELPLWMIRDSSGGLAGGVRLGYRTDQHRATVVGFVGDIGKSP
jgi:hypothetical protein